MTTSPTRKTSCAGLLNQCGFFAKRVEPCRLSCWIKTCHSKRVRDNIFRESWSNEPGRGTLPWALSLWCTYEGPKIAGALLPVIRRG